MAVGTSFQLTLFFFCLIDLLLSFHLCKSAKALRLPYKILVVYILRFFCLSVFHIILPLKFT
jgi:hypothetical protein